MTKADKYFIDFTTQILENGYNDLHQNVRTKWSDYKDGKKTITPAHTHYILGTHEVYDLGKNEWPIIHAREIKFKKAIGEMLWIWRDGDNNLDNLAKRYDVHWWDEWDVGDRTIGQRYGATNNKYKIFENVIKELEQNSFSRRIIADLWQYQDLKEIGGLSPCVYKIQFLVTQEFGFKKLHMIADQRSNDYIVAGHINRMQYAALQLLLAKHLDMELGTLTWNTGNLHIYDRHIPIAAEMLDWYDFGDPIKQPKLILKDDINFWNAMPDDFILEDYNVYSQYKLQVAI